MSLFSARTAGWTSAEAVEIRAMAELLAPVERAPAAVLAGPKRRAEPGLVEWTAAWVVLVAW
jgi:hypothetical protein